MQTRKVAKKTHASRASETRTAMTMRTDESKSRGAMDTSVDPAMDTAGQPHLFVAGTALGQTCLTRPGESRLARNAPAVAAHRRAISGRLERGSGVRLEKVAVSG